ncbi:MAG: hypothetical protein ACLFTZ_05020 [Acholeplasmataceae bacterium]
MLDARDYLQELRRTSDRVYLDALGVHLDLSYDQSLLILLFSLLQDKNKKRSSARAEVDESMLAEAGQVFERFSDSHIESVFFIGPEYRDALKHYRIIFNELRDVDIRAEWQLISFWQRMREGKGQREKIALSTHEVDVVRITNHEISYYTSGEVYKLSADTKPYVAWFQVLREFPAINRETFRFLELDRFLGKQAKKAYREHLNSELITSLLSADRTDQEWEERARALNDLVRDGQIMRYLDYDYPTMQALRKDR